MQDSEDRTAADPGSYDVKAGSYFEGARKDFVDELPDDPHAHILEIGCSNGNTGALALAMGKCERYAGVEIHRAAALVAREKLSEVLIGDIERIDLPWEQQSFDALILSEVLEHLVDPWKVLLRLHSYLKPGALVLASSPNVSHHRIIRMLLRGEWNLTDDGIMDRTHLRWFTPKSFAQMFEDCGYQVDKVEPMSPFRFQTRFQIALLFGRAKHLFVKQMKLRAVRKEL